MHSVCYDLYTHAMQRVHVQVYNFTVQCTVHENGMMLSIPDLIAAFSE